MVPDERRDLGVAPALLLEVVDDTAVHESQHPWSPLTGRTCPLVRWSVAPSMPHFRQESRCLLYDNLHLRTAHYAETYGEASCLLLWVAAGARRLQNALRTLGGAVRDEPALRGRVLLAALGGSARARSWGRSGGWPTAASGARWSGRGCATTRSDDSPEILIGHTQLRGGRLR